jgi:hypothetical protein
MPVHRHKKDTTPPLPGGASGASHSTAAGFKAKYSKRYRGGGQESG